MKVTGMDTWVVEIEDRPGALAEKLGALAGAGADLEFVISQRGPETGDVVRVFVAPVKGVKQIRAARDAGFEKHDNVRTLRVDGPDKPGLLARMAEALAAAGLNLRGITATSAGRQSITHMAIAGADDARKAARILKNFTGK